MTSTVKSGAIALLLAVAAAVTGGALYLLRDGGARLDEAPTLHGGVVVEGVAP